MATARKTPVKRPASVSDASGATKRTRGAQLNTNTQKIDGVRAATGRKTPVKDAVVAGKATRSAALKAAKPEKAARPNGAARPSKAATGEAETLPAKGNGRAVGAEAGGAQALVPEHGEV